MSDPAQWNELIARAGRAAVYGLLTPWHEARGDYAPPEAASPARIQYAYDGAVRAMETERLALMRAVVVQEGVRLHKRGAFLCCMS